MAAAAWLVTGMMTLAACGGEAERRASLPPAAAAEADRQYLVVPLLPGPAFQRAEPSAPYPIALQAEVMRPIVAAAAADGFALSELARVRGKDELLALIVRDASGQGATLEARFADGAVLYGRLPALPAGRPTPVVLTASRSFAGPGVLRLRPARAATGSGVVLELRF